MIAAQLAVSRSEDPAGSPAARAICLPILGGFCCVFLYHLVRPGASRMCWRARAGVRSHHSPLAPGIRSGWVAWVAWQPLPVGIRAASGRVWFVGRVGNHCRAIVAIIRAGCRVAVRLSLPGWVAVVTRAPPARSGREMPALTRVCAGV